MEEKEKQLSDSLDDLSKRLFDLSLRNPLLAFRERGSSTLRITNPGLIAFYNRLVEKGLDYAYPAGGEDEETFAVMAKGEESFFSLAIHEEPKTFPSIPSGEFRTEKKISDTNRVLQNLRGKNRNYESETGLHILFVSFGFVRFNDPDNPVYRTDADGKKILVPLAAPLLLVPIEIKRNGSGSSYHIAKDENDILLNPTLAFKFRKSFGIDLPLFDDAKDGLAEYLEKVEKLISSNGFALEKVMEISVLPFQNMAMYEDSILHKKKMMENPVLSDLLVNTANCTLDDSSLQDIDFDKTADPKNLYEIVDADSSQMDALAYARAGKSFVLQGPPGTGKSQTITNIIAESIADGKKVLFVAQKQAALDVVSTRLKESGLGPFILNLHSDKTTRTEVVDSLMKTLDLASSSYSLPEEDEEDLKNLKLKRDEIDTYAEELHRKQKPLGKSLFDVANILSGMEKVDTIQANITDLEYDKEEDIRRKKEEVVTYSSFFQADLSEISQNYWYENRTDFRNKDLVAVFKKFVTTSGSEVEDALHDLKSLSFFGIPMLYSEEDMEKVLPFLSFALTYPDVPKGWLFLQKIGDFPKILSGSDARELFYGQRKEKIIADVSAASKDLKDYPPLKEVDLASSVSVKGYGDSVEGRLAANNTLSLFYKNANLRKQAEELLPQVIQNQRKYQEALKGPLAGYDKKILDLDYKEMMWAYRNAYRNPLGRCFNGNYHRDKKRLLSYLRSGSIKPSYKDSLAVFEALDHVHEAKDYFDKNSKLLSDTYGFAVDSLTDLSSLPFLFREYDLDTAILQDVKDLSEIDFRNEEFLRALKEGYGLDLSGYGIDFKDYVEKAKWAKDYQAKVPDSYLWRDFTAKLSDKEFDLLSLEAMVHLLESHKMAIDEMKTTAADFSLFNKIDFSSTPLEVISKQMETYHDHFEDLDHLFSLITCRQKMKEEGILPFIIEAEGERTPLTSIGDVFLKAYYYSWMKRMAKPVPVLREFTREGEEASVRRFLALDRKQLEIARRRIFIKLLNSLPSYKDAVGQEEASVLKKESVKKRKLLSTRKLFLSVPHLLLTLKPCLMMSPLTVSMFLESDVFQFDTVIFDEASQVLPESALGAIYRGKQVIIAGDMEQLPPTSFYQILLSGDDDYKENDAIDGFDSILALAQGLPQKMLRWHYRSRDESLISFSNSYIYKNRLITFPGNKTKDEDFGLDPYLYCKDGVYDTYPVVDGKGRTRKSKEKGNLPEALLIASLVIDHIRKYYVPAAMENGKAVSGHFTRTLGVIAFGVPQQECIRYAIAYKIRLLPADSRSLYEEATNEDSRSSSFFVKNLENVQGDERDTILLSIGYARDSEGHLSMNFGPLNGEGGYRRLNVAITRAKYNLKLVGSLLPGDFRIEETSSKGLKMLKDYISYSKTKELPMEEDPTGLLNQDRLTGIETEVKDTLESMGYKVVTHLGVSSFKIGLAVSSPDYPDGYALGILFDGQDYARTRTARDRDRIRNEFLTSIGWNLYHIWTISWTNDKFLEKKKLFQAVEDSISTYNERRRATNSKPVYEARDDEEEDFSSTLDREDKGNSYGFEDYPSITTYKALGTTDSDIVQAVIDSEYPVHRDYLLRRLKTIYGPDYRREDALMNIKLQLTRREILPFEEVFYVPSLYDRIHVRLSKDRDIDEISLAELSLAFSSIAKLSFRATKADLFRKILSGYGIERMTDHCKGRLEEAYRMAFPNTEIGSGSEVVKK